MNFPARFIIRRSKNSFARPCGHIDHEEAARFMHAGCMPSVNVQSLVRQAGFAPSAEATPDCHFMSKTTGKVPKGMLHRASKIVGLGLRMAAREASNQLAKRSAGASKDEAKGSRFELNLRHVSGLVDVLSELKGGAMKLGQLISLEFSDVLPPEMVELLSRLHANVPALPGVAIKKILRKELGEERFGAISDFSEEPVAAASIGQVHSGWVDGKKVAIKIQYPGISRSIDSDVRLLQRLMSVLFAASGKSINLDDVSDEIRQTLKREADYRREAQSISDFGALGSEPHYRLPTVLPEFSSKRVLTMTFMEGISVRAWLTGHPGPDDINWFCHAMLNLVLTEFFRLGIVQTDPNYGNFLVDPQHRKIILLDFGATSRYSKKFRQEIRSVLDAVIAGGTRESILSRCIEWGLLDPRESPETRAVFSDMLENIGAIFRPGQQPFRFNDLEYLRRIRESAWAFVRSVRYSAPKKQIIFLNRKLGGIYHILKDAGGSCDLHHYWREVMAMEIETFRP